MSEGLTVVVGVTGGIAAYKAAAVVRGLVGRGHTVHVVATEAALRFVGAPTFEALSGNPVVTDLYRDASAVPHLRLARLADVLAVVPATAHTLARLAAGLADDVLGNVALATRAPLVLAPAMHTEMWTHPATRANATLLGERGAVLVGPADGPLTGPESGEGRLEEPETIVEAIVAAAPRTHGSRRDEPSRAAATASARSDLAGRRLLVSAGGTREPLDPVRFLGNRSSGRQGVALAQAARDRGAEVTLVAAHLEVPTPKGVEVVPVGTARELREAMAARSSRADAIVMAAAVADFRPVSVRDDKIKKGEGAAPPRLELEQNPDVLAELAAGRRDGQTIVGFAAETEPDPATLLELGRRKLERKGCDLLVLNQVGWTSGFSSAENEVVVLRRGGDIVLEAAGDKMSVADRILDAIVSG